MGSTPVDFAYHIHTEVGNQMKGVRINDRWSVVDKPLQNGDMVEIITSKNTHPSLDWLNFVVTPTARTRIRQWFKKYHYEENLARGHKLLEKELGKSGLEALLKSEQMQNVAFRCNYQKVEDLLAALGYGEVTLNQIVNKLREDIKAKQSEITLTNETESELLSPPPIRHVSEGESSTNSPIAGVEGMLYHCAGCCKPLPGEPIMGVVTITRGISIHHQQCRNLENISGERLIPVSWNPINKNGRASTYPVDLQIEVLDRVGIFRDILGRLSDRNINVSNASVKTSFDKPALISLTVDLCDRQQLDYILNQIRNMSDILNIRRIN